MIPTSTSNKLSKGCDPVSSNCVVWEGPDLPCIDLCNGDTISDVVALLAQKLCDIIDAACTCDPDISDVHTHCLLADGATPFATLDELLSAMNAYMCNADNFPGGEWVDGPTGGVPLGCLDYYNETTNSNQGTLSVTEFLTFLASKICELTTTINTINAQITIIRADITALQVQVNALSAPAINIVSNCSDITAIVGTGSVGIATWGAAVDGLFCTLRSNVGSIQDVAAAVSAPCVLGNMPMLSQDSTYGNTDVTGPWFSPVYNLAQGQHNLWKVVCDLYTAVADIKENCCAVDCDDITYGFVTSLVVDGAGVTTAINFNFTSSSIPALFYDCGNGAIITVEDGAGGTISNAVEIYPLQNSALGYDFDVTTLTQSANYTVKIEFCFVSQDGSNIMCQFTESRNVINSLICPNPVSLTPTVDSVQYSFNQTNGPSVDIDVFLTLGGTVVASNAFSNPISNPITGTFSGLAPSTQYGVSIVITPAGGGPSTTCATEFITTTAVTCTNIQDTAAYPTTATATTITLGTTTSDGINYSNIWIEEDVSNNPFINLETLALAPACAATLGSCIVGTDLETVSFTCGVDTYNAPGASGWYFFDSYTAGDGAVYYIYAAWDTASGYDEVLDVIFCCECPAWLLDQQQLIQATETAIFNLVSVSFGTPVTYSVTTLPLYGTVTQPSPGVFNYELSFGSSQQQDAFTVEMVTPCGTVTAVCSIVIIAGGGRYNAGTKTFVFIDTNTISIADGADIVATMNQVMTHAGALCSAFGGAPEIFHIPVNDSDWMGYIKAIVDKGTSASLDPAPAWVALQQLPTDWTVPIPEVETDDVQVVVFSNSYDTGYHASTLVSGFTGPPVQPATAYQASYDDARAALDGGVNTTVWWAGTGLTGPQFSVGFRFLLLPVATGSVGLDSASLLMMYASLYGTLVPEQAYIRLTGNTDLSGFLKDPPAPINPYAGTVTPAGNTMTGLMVDPDGQFFMELGLVVGASPFDYAASDFIDFVYDRTIGTPCPGTAVWKLTPCAAFAAYAPIYTETDLSAYEADDRAVNVAGVCYTVNEVTPGPVTAPVTVCADSWVGGNECTDCSNWLLTSCSDPADTMIVCQNFGASVSNVIELTGVGVDGCYSVAATNSAPDYFTTLTLVTSCVQCIDCLATNLSIGLPLGNWDLVNSNIWSDNGVTAIVDGADIARIDSLNGTCGTPTTPVLGNALNLTTLDEYTYELDGITGKGPDAEAVGGGTDVYLSVANNAAMDTGICTVYVAFATSAGGAAQDHIWSMTSNNTLTDGLGLIYDGTNLVVWGNDESNAAYKINLGAPVVDDISVIAIQFDSGASELRAQWTSGGTLTTVSCPWVNPASDLILGGTPDAAGNPVENTASGRLYQALFFNEEHSAADITAVITEIETKFSAP
tara:strand:- start:501 stop:4703 length:4203 start_codon:yes stop_codon:yes gene_type:complete